MNKLVFAGTYLSLEENRMIEETPVQPAPKKMNTALIIGIVVVVLLCCCCIIVGGGGYYYFSTKVKDTYSSINEALQTPVVPEIPVIPLPTNEAGTPEIPAMPDNLIPQGGLGDDLLRANTWGYVLTGAAMSGCAATDPTKTSIEVLEKPDSAGAWKEKWTVTCDDGTQKAFDVAFTPGAQGGTDINVTSSK
jgi:hypothetical protein